MKKWIIIALLCYCGCISAQSAHEMRDSVKIYFRQGKINIEPSFSENQLALDRIADSLRMVYADSAYRLLKILVVGGASPEGSVKRNNWLSERRAGVLLDKLSRYGALPDSLTTTEFIGRDWEGLMRLVQNDTKVPYKDETIALLRKIAGEVHAGVITNGNHLALLQQLRGGVPYYYMYHNLFPELRAAQLYLLYKKDWAHITLMPDTTAQIMTQPRDTVIESVHDTIYIRETCPAKHVYMDIRTNMLYDALLLPNIGLELYIGKGWSVMGNWMYGWWRRDRSHWYRRAYGGDIAVRKWIGKAAKGKPLTGHHIGIYGQIFTYDFETGGRGYMAGKTGATLWDKMNYAAGMEYGYSLPIARRLNIDFTIGAGYCGGTYHEYIPIDDCYVWQATKQRHWFGPTKVEVSLVWLLGTGNFNNKKKGGPQ